MIVCQNCGAVLPDIARFCSECGCCVDPSVHSAPAGAGSVPVDNATRQSGGARQSDGARQPNGASRPNDVPRPNGARQPASKPPCAAGSVSQQQPLGEQQDATVPRSSSAGVQGCSESDSGDVLDDGSLYFIWKMSVGATFVGVMVWAFFGFVVPRVMLLCGMSVGTLESESYLLVALGVLCCVYLIAGVVYALGVYPSYFSRTPRITDGVTISFFNGMFGGIIFGCLWNTNLTMGKRGCSYIVFAVFAVLWVFSFFSVPAGL